VYTLVVKNKDKMKRYGNGRRKGYSKRGRDERTNEQTYIRANRGAKRERGREGRDGGVSMVVECVGGGKGEGKKERRQAIVKHTRTAHVAHTVTSCKTVCAN
jgi:hypothetical protein